MVSVADQAAMDAHEQWVDGWVRVALCATEQPGLDSAEGWNAFHLVGTEGLPSQERLIHNWLVLQQAMSALPVPESLNSWLPCLLRSCSVVSARCLEDCYHDGNDDVALPPEIEKYSALIVKAGMLHNLTLHA